MDAGIITGYGIGYLITLALIFLLYLPDLVLVVMLLIAAGLIQLLLLPFALLVRKLRRSQPPHPHPDSSWILDSSEQELRPHKPATPELPALVQPDRDDGDRN